MAEVVRIASGAPWEPVVAYSRTVQADGFVAVSGTTATVEGSIVGSGQMYVQARQALLNIRAALERAGLTMRDVIRTRMFVTDIARWEEVARAHREFFADSPPACTMVEVRRLISPDMLIEIEADGYRGAAAPRPIAKASARPRAKPAKPAPRKKTPTRGKRQK